MTPRAKKTAAALSGALVLASGAYALGSQAGDGSALATGKSSSDRRPVGYGRPGPGRHGGARDLSDIAGRLGVTEAKLRAALEDLRPDRAAKDEHQAALAKALAAELGLSAAKVTTALEKFHGERKAARRERHGDRLHRFDDALAAKLGVDAAKVRAAFDALRPGARRGTKPDLADLAAKIGVTEAKLRSALADLRPGPGLRRDGKRPGDPARLSALAKELGVTQAKLRAALEKVRDDVVKRHEAEREAFAGKLAAKLGISEAKVKDVIASGPHHERRGP